MNERDAYVEKMKSRLDAWNAEIDRLEARAREAEADARIRYAKQIESLKAQRAEAEEHLARLRTAGDAAWKDFTTGIEGAWDAMEDALKSALSRFR